MHELPYEGTIDPNSKPQTEPPRPDTTLRGEIHTPPPPIDATPEFVPPSTVGIRVGYFIGPAALAFLLAIILAMFYHPGVENPLLGILGNAWLVVIIQSVFIFFVILVMEYLFSLTGSAAFLWLMAAAVVLFFFGVLYFFDKNFFDPSVKLDLGPVAQIFETIKPYFGSPF